MRKYVAVLVALSLVALLYAWRTPAGVKPAPQKWEFNQIRLVQNMPDALAASGDPSKVPDRKELDAIAEQNKGNLADFDAGLQKAGSEGWELVTVTSQPPVRIGNGTIYMQTAFLKRPTP